MNVETTRETEVICKNLIKEAVPAWGFPDFDALWEKIEAALKFDFSTTVKEDVQGKTILEEALEEAYDHGADHTDELPDVDQLWERLCEVLGVEV